MLSITALANPTTHVAVFEDLLDSEIGHLLVELRSGRFTGTCFNVLTVAQASEPLTTVTCSSSPARVRIVGGK